MKMKELAGVLVFCTLLSSAGGVLAAGDVTLFRVFLKDGSELVSYGEFARVGDRVVFSMPLSAEDNPPLHLINLAASRVDWERTNRFAESARASHYEATSAEADYAAISDRVAQTLSQISQTTDATKRLQIVEAARKMLADWPPEHYYYRASEVRQMLAVLDEAITNLRAASGGDRFNLDLVAWTDGPPPEAVEPPPAITPREAIEQTLVAARVADSDVERLSLLNAALAEVDRAADALPATWVAETRAATQLTIAQELETDRAYQALTTEFVRDVSRRARFADVRGIEKTLTLIHARDAELGGKRPDSIAALLGEVEHQLDAARQLRLARDRWALRAPVLSQYRDAVAWPLHLLATVESALESIKSLAGSPPGSLVAIQRAASQAKQAASLLTPPEEMRAVHALLLSAADLANNAARIRREAILTGSMPRAWDASAAAAGALMLATRARTDLRAALRVPQLVTLQHP